MERPVVIEDSRGRAGEVKRGSNVKKPSQSGQGIVSSWELLKARTSVGLANLVAWPTTWTLSYSGMHRCVALSDRWERAMADILRSLFSTMTGWPAAAAAKSIQKTQWCGWRHT